jgi:Tol biopolymer transport system component/imidazolonepropionase-like amidohydrolase
VLAFALLPLSSAHRAAAQDAVEWNVTVPRGEPRVVEFDTDVGTWMSLDVSPDGRWIAFNLLGHIYRVAIGGGVAENLTQGSGMALNLHPRYSPNGRTIAFVSDRAGEEDLWLMDVDGGNPRTLAVDPSSRPSELDWTPDGENLVVRVLGSDGGLWLYRADGASRSRLLAGASWPSVTPDGKHVYYQVFGGFGGRVGWGDLLDGAYQLRRLTLDGGHVVDITAGVQRQMMKGSSGGAIAPEISPDGRWLAFARRIPDGTVSYKGQRYGPRTALWLRDLATGAERKLMDPIEQDMGEGVKTLRVLPSYSWMPDAGSIVIAQGGRIRRVHLNDEVETIPFTARVRRAMSERVRFPVRITDEAFRAEYLRWHTESPDGSRLTFQAVGRVWVQDLPSGTPRRLTSGESGPFEYAPVWSPDGLWVAFTTWDETGGGHLWKAPAAGGAAVQLTTTSGEYVNPDWSADGRELLVARGSGATLRGRVVADNEWFDIVRVHADASGVASVVTRVDGFGTGLGSATGALPRPAWGSDGRIFFLEPDAEEGGAVYTSIEPDGTDRRVHLRFAGGVQDAVPSPDRRWAAFVQGGNVHIAPLPARGAVPPEGVRAGGPDVRTISRGGGLHPRWRDARTLEYGSGRDHFVHSIDGREPRRASVELHVPRDIPRGTIALTGARIITIGAQGVIENGTVVVEGSRIRCVGACSTEGVDRVVYASGRTIMPGLVDTHAHHYAGHAGMIPVRSTDHAVYLAYGITTSHDPAAPSADLFTAGELVRAGKVVGPRVFSTGESLRDDRTLSTYEATKAVMRTRQSWGANQVKVHFHAPRRVRQWVVEAARELGMNVTSEGDDLHADLAMVMDGQTGIEHMLSYMPVYDDVAKFFGRSGVCYNPTLLGAGPGPWDEEYWFAEAQPWKDPKQRRWVPWRDLADSRRTMLRPASDYSFAMGAQALADMIDEGSCGSFGGHYQQPGISTHWHLWIATEALAPLEAIRVATLGGAEMLGMDADLGSIDVGKLADLVVLNADPLENIHNSTDLALVMRGGVLYDADTLDEVWPRQRPFGGYPWLQPDVYPGDDRATDYWDRKNR